VSAFGGIIAVNRPLDERVVAAFGDLMLDGLAAPAVTPAALEMLRKRKRLRLIEIPLDSAEILPWDIRTVHGNIVTQQRDRMPEDESAWKVVTQRAPTAEEWEGLRFGWRVAKHVKSNAIVLGRGKATIGIGAGQMSRVDSVKIAIMKAQQVVAGSVMASDAFFPFAAGIEEAAKAGITAVIEPGGSLRDADAIAAANAHQMAMVFTGTRHFRH